MGKKPEKISNPSGIITGIVMILIGIFLILDTYNILSFSIDYVLLIIGAIFLLSYYYAKSPGLLIPGVMLTLFSIIMLLNIESLFYLWLLSISLSFFAVYLTKRKDTAWAIIPGSILLAISLITVFEFYTSINAFPIILMGIGAYLLYKNYKKGKK